MKNWTRELYILVIAQCFTSMGFSIIFPFLPLYISDLNSLTNFNKETLSGLVFSAQAVSMMVISPFWGAIADRVGKKPMVIRAVTGGAITIFLMGFVKTAEMLIVLRILQGLLSGVVSATSALAVSISPTDKKGYSLGLLQTGVWSGISLGPLTGGILSDFFGFRLTFIITAILLFSSGLTVLFFVNENTDFHKTEQNNKKLLFQWKEIFSSGNLSATFFLRFLGSIAGTILLPVIPLFIQTIINNKERTGTMTGLVLGISSVASITGSFILAHFGDKTGHSKVVLIGSILAALFFLPQTFVHSIWLLIVLNFGTGLCIGSITPSLSALLVNYSKTGSEGSVYGIDNSLVAAGRAIAPLIGVFIVVQFTYRAIFLATSLIFVLMAVIVSNIFFRKDTLSQH